MPRTNRRVPRWRWPVRSRSSPVPAEKRLQEERLAEKVNEHYGEIKERLNLTLTVTRIHEIDGTYGLTYITSFEDAEGRSFKWFGSYVLEVGAEYEGKWNVKNHDEYKGRKETVITRPHGLEERI